MAVEINIYTLSDPNTNKIMYVGKTRNIPKRYSDHINEAKKSNLTKKQQWINSLLNNGLKPKIEILDTCSEDESEIFESFYISLIKSWGFDLTNIFTSGMSESMKGNKYAVGLTHKRKSIKALIDGELRVFESISHASNELNLSRRAISNNVNGRSKTAYGIKFSQL